MGGKEDLNPNNHPDEEQDDEEDPLEYDPAESFAAYYKRSNLSQAEINHLLVTALVTLKTTRSTYDSLDTVAGCKGRSKDGFEEVFGTVWKVRNRLNKEARMVLKYIDCCINGCRAYTGRWAKSKGCKCGQLRKEAFGRPRRLFLYMSPLNRLRALFASKIASKQLNHRRDRKVEEGVYNDVFDGSWYQYLLTQFVTWEGTEQAHKYFEQDTDIAFSLSTDGVPLYRGSKLDCWPLILTIFSVSLDKRMQRSNQICLGLIPGTRSQTNSRDVDIDSFLQPLPDDMEILATTGTQAMRWVERVNPQQQTTQSSEEFTLRAYILSVSGDMPAIAKLMHFKGHNAISPCRWCHMLAIRDPGEDGSKTHYLTKARPEDVDYSDLPLREHQETVDTAESIQYNDANLSKEQIEALKKASGINSVAALTVLDSISCPWSFTADIVHILFENIMKELLLLWEGTYKTKTVLGDGKKKLKEAWVISPAVWKEMSNDIAKSMATIPTQMCRTISSIESRGFWTAETYSFFMAWIGPSILKNRLPEPYHAHFYRLSLAARTLTAVEITERG